jgi:carbamoyl-phosphate synthase/aspartate carbamoyltransferase
MQVEVVVNRSFVFPKCGDYWSPLSSKPIKGAVHRVILHGQTVFLDGAFVAPPSGKDVSAAIISHPMEKPAAALPIPNLSVAQLSAPSTAARQMQTHSSTGVVGAVHGPARLQQTLTFHILFLTPPSIVGTSSRSISSHSERRDVAGHNPDPRMLRRRGR